LVSSTLELVVALQHLCVLEKEQKAGGAGTRCLTARDGVTEGQRNSRERSWQAHTSKSRKAKSVNKTTDTAEESYRVPRQLACNACFLAMPMSVSPNSCPLSLRSQGMRQCES